MPTPGLTASLRGVQRNAWKDDIEAHDTRGAVGSLLLYNVLQTPEKAAFIYLFIYLFYTHVMNALTYLHFGGGALSLVHRRSNLVGIRVYSTAHTHTTTYHIPHTTHPRLLVGLLLARWFIGWSTSQPNESLSSTPPTHSTTEKKTIDLTITSLSLSLSLCATKKNKSIYSRGATNISGSF
eukprot:gene4677-3371_t